MDLLACALLFLGQFMRGVVKQPEQHFPRA